MRFTVFVVLLLGFAGLGKESPVSHLYSRSYIRANETSLSPDPKVKVKVTVKSACEPSGPSGRRLFPVSVA